ncbi:hypothetical protein Hanom_Chr04g00309371 [Helianthus anomalus]
MLQTLSRQPGFQLCDNLILRLHFCLIRFLLFCNKSISPFYFCLIHCLVLSNNLIVHLYFCLLLCNDFVLHSYFFHLIFVNLHKFLKFFLPFCKKLLIFHSYIFRLVSINLRLHRYPCLLLCSKLILPLCFCLWRSLLFGHCLW